MPTLHGAVECQCRRQVDIHGATTHRGLDDEERLIMVERPALDIAADE